MFWSRFVFLVTVVLLFSACASPIKISTDYDTEVNFSKFQKYRWQKANEDHQASENYQADDLTERRVHNNVDQQLQHKGYQKLDKGPVDFLIKYSVIIKDKSSLNSYNPRSGVSVGGGVGTYGSGVGIGYTIGSDDSESFYQQWILIIDFLDPQTEKLLWRGSASTRLPQEQNQSERETMISESVAKILTEFPPERK